MATKKITDVDTITSLKDSNTLFINEEGTVKQIPLNESKLMRMELLWENATPTSEFGAQTVTLDLSEYDEVEVRFVFATTVTNRISNNVTVPVGIDGYCLNMNGVVFVRRQFQTTDSGVSFEDCGKFTTYANSAVISINSALIPYQIYGIKGVKPL